MVQGKSLELGIKDDGVLKSQTNPGERGLLSVWFAFGALILRRLHMAQSRFREGETKKADTGGKGDECQVKVLMYRGKKQFYIFLPLTLQPSQSAGLRLWEFLSISCDRVPLSQECFVRSQGAPHIRGIRLAPVRWAHSVGREDSRRAGERSLTAHCVSAGASSCREQTLPLLLGKDESFLKDRQLTCLKYPFHY